MKNFQFSVYLPICIIAALLTACSSLPSNREVPAPAVPAPAVPAPAVPAPAVPAPAVPAPAVPAPAVPAPAVPAPAVPAPVPDADFAMDSLEATGAGFSLPAKTSKPVISKQTVKSKLTKIETPTSTTPEIIKEVHPSFDAYSVRLSATEKLTIPGPPGELKVWIGEKSHLPEGEAGMTSKTIEIEAAGNTAKITPIERGIPVNNKQSICGKLSPRGSEFVFTLMPNAEGKFEVGATIELYESADCTGVPIPKSAKAVSVEVSVNYENVVKNAIYNLVERTWKLFLAFWDKLVILILGLILFLVRRKLSQAFGYSGDDKAK